MFENIRNDIDRYDLHQCVMRYGIFECAARWILGFGIQAVLVYRYGQWVEKRFCRPYSWLLQWCLLLPYWAANGLIKKLYGIKISKKARIGAGFYVGHFGGIEVGACCIGENCSIQQNVKILPAGNTKELPEIGSFVWIGAHVQIIGGLIIADRATIAAGSHVAKNVESGCLVSGNPARVINKKYDNSAILGTAI